MCNVKRFNHFRVLFLLMLMVFCVGIGAGNAAEVDVTSDLIAAGQNEAEIAFPIDDGTEYVTAINYLGFTWANYLAPSPAQGATNFVTGMPKQLPGNSGFSVEIPLVSGTYKGLTGMECSITLTPTMVGQRTFDEMVAFLVEKHETQPSSATEEGGFAEDEDEEGNEYYVFYSAKELFNKYGIFITGLFSDGTDADVSEYFQCGTLYDENRFEEGKIDISFGPILADSAPINDEYAIDLTEMFQSPIKLAIVYDGIADDTLNFSFWLAGERRDYGDSGGGCNAGADMFGLVGLVGVGTFLLRKRGK
jgi:hypothetical protein